MQVSGAPSTTAPSSFRRRTDAAGAASSRLAASPHRFRRQFPPGCGHFPWRGRAAPQTDIVARLGGKEFIALLPSTALEAAVHGAPPRLPAVKAARSAPGHAQRDEPQHRRGSRWQDRRERIAEPPQRAGGAADQIGEAPPRQRSIALRQSGMQQEQAEQNGDANRNKESVPTSSDATAAVKPPIDRGSRHHLFAIGELKKRRSCESFSEKNGKWSRKRKMNR